MKTWLTHMVAFLVATFAFAGVTATQANAQGIEIFRIQSDNCIALSVQAGAWETGLTLQVSSDILTFGIKTPKTIESPLLEHSMPFIQPSSDRMTLAQLSTITSSVGIPVRVKYPSPVDSIAFQSDSLTPSTVALLEQMAQTLNNHQEIKQIAIKSPSKAQAGAVAAQLVEFGVETNRIAMVQDKSDATTVQIVDVRRFN